MTLDASKVRKRTANWLGSPKRVISQLLVSGWSFVSFPVARLKNSATKEYFTELYNGRSDPLIFDGKDHRYFEQIEMVYDIGNLNKQTILDLGSGNGSMFRWLKKRKVNFTSYTGIDFAYPEIILDKNAHIIQKDIADINVKEINPSAVFAINTLCYLNTSTVQSILNSRKQDDEIIIIDPIPGLFWDAHFCGVRLFYREPHEVIEILKSAGWQIRGMSIDYAIGWMNTFFFPLSYCLFAK